MGKNPVKIDIYAQASECEPQSAHEMPLFDMGLNIVTGKHPGYSIVNKFGRLQSTDLQSLPEDVWNAGGVYTGFPIGAPDEFEVFSSDRADTGNAVFQYLENEQATEYKIGTVKINGTTPVPTGISGHRMHTARYDNGTPNGFNSGAITIRHRANPQNVFCRMPIGRSQTAVAAITVPAGHTGYLIRVFAAVIGDTNTSIDFGVWIRDTGESPRIRRPFSCNALSRYEERPVGGIPVLEHGDVTLRVIGARQPFGEFKIMAGFDIVFVKNSQ